jgi:hypothetical protein
MQVLQFPVFEYKIKVEQNQHFIWEVVRKKWLLLTPEEWVRQHLIHYLNKYKAYPLSLMHIEKQIQLNSTKKRFDFLAYNNQLNPILLVECKAPDVKLDQLVLDQVLRYNLEVKAEYIMITNGIRHYCFQYQAANKTFQIINEIPSYQIEL